MLIKEKINIQKYLIGSTANYTLMLFLWVKNLNDALTFLALQVIVIINHYMLVKGISLTLDVTNLHKKKGFKIALFIGGKTILLGIAFYVATYYDSKKIIYLLILYIFQLIILGLSIKKAQ